MATYGRILAMAHNMRKQSDPAELGSLWEPLARKNRRKIRYEKQQNV